MNRESILKFDSENNQNIIDWWEKHNHSYLDCYEGGRNISYGNHELIITRGITLYSGGDDEDGLLKETMLIQYRLSSSDKKSLRISIWYPEASALHFIEREFTSLKEVNFKEMLKDLTKENQND